MLKEERKGKGNGLGGSHYDCELTGGGGVELGQHKKMCGILYFLAITQR